jgi:hypothetical protein
MFCTSGPPAGKGRFAFPLASRRPVRVAFLAGHTTASGRPNLRTTVRYTTPSRQELQQAVESLEWSRAGTGR